MSLRTRVKICGVTRVEDALQAVAAGADAIGLVFYEPSPRNVSISMAREICAELPPFVTVVGLFVDKPISEVHEILNQVPIGLLQFHGDESESYCAKFNHPYIKAVRVQSGQDVLDAEHAFPSAQGLLVDTYKQGVAGGTGETFDWSVLPKELSKPLILAGGLNAENVRKAIDMVSPFAVDVSGGVELSKGIKDPEKVLAFIKEVSRG